MPYKASQHSYDVFFVARGSQMQTVRCSQDGTCTWLQLGAEFGPLPQPGQAHYYFFFGHKNSLFGHNRFSTLFFSMKIAESEKIVLASCIIEFKDIQVWLRHFSLNLNACRVMTVFFKIWPENLKKTVITLQALRFKLKCLNQTCISLNWIMQLARPIFSDSAIFMEKKRVENRFCGQKKLKGARLQKTKLFLHTGSMAVSQHARKASTPRGAQFDSISRSQGSPPKQELHEWSQSSQHSHRWRVQEIG